jgi:predicted DNA-binding protein
MVVDLTIHVPDELRRQVDRLAAARGETISDLVSEALAHYFAELLEEADDVAAAEEIEARLLTGQEQIKTGPETYEALED